ncbi:MAG: efflux RND transporter permease subunit [Alphaproteobacteria bacterium]|nr:efflux RND transporter permease subunit [Alphaproteobacteria bacterium]MCB9931676.1 efflux RND transporter permease subunit [Alphaproteobacteria bacterium]
MNLMIVIAGIAALFGVEVRELPDIDRPLVSIRANYPGASPTTVDAEVTAAVEGAVARVAGVVAVQSSSEEGNFRMRVEFRPDRDLADAANDVREAVARVAPQLPDGVKDLFVVKAEQDAWPIMRIAVWSDRDAIDELSRRVDDEIVPELTAVDGVADVVVFGSRLRVVRVEVRPERLAAYGLSIGEVADVLAAAQFDVPVGSFAAGQTEVLVRADATVAEPGRIQQLRVRGPVRLGDVADVYFGLQTPESMARRDGRTIVSVGIVRQAQSNTVAISDDVQATLARLEQRFPDLHFAVTGDDAVFIRGAIGEVVYTLVLALVIVVAVIWLFLGRLGATMIPAVAIPIALIGAMAAIWLLGFSVNLITLLALVLATGIVVDDAIVVAENIQSRRADGMGRMAAAVVGTRQVFFAVIATTVTLIAVFIPISFLPSDAGRLFAEFGFVLAITVALSSFVALSVCPMIASKLPSLGGTPGLLGRFGHWLIRRYMALLRPLLAAPLVVVTVAAIAGASSILVYGDLGEELVPPEDRGQITVRLQGPDGTGLAYTDRQVERVEAMLRPWVERGVAEGLYSVSGWYDLNRGYIGARLIPWAERSVSQADIERDLRPKLARLAGANARVTSGNSLGLRRGSDGGITVALTGPSYPAIADAAFAFADRMEALPGLSAIRVQYQATQPQLSITIDRERASDLGVPMAALSATLRALIDEDEIAELTIDDQAVPILLQSAAGTVRDPADLLNLYVRAEAGHLVPLSQLVTFSEQGVAAELDRHGQRRAIEIDAAVAPDLTLRGAVDLVQGLARESLPPGIGLLLLGEAAALDETSHALTVTYVIALVVVFLVLVAQFESLTSAAVVMVTVPFGVAAAIYALWLTGTTVNIYSQIGVLMLIGIMAKNGILLVEFADQLRERGYAVAEAALEASRLRIRAIAMTLASTVLAGLPLILSGGPGAEARAAIGWVVFGGLGLAAAFTLFLTPVAYVLVAGLARSRAAAGVALEAELRQAGHGDD